MKSKAAQWEVAVLQSEEDETLQTVKEHKHAYANIA